MIEYTFEWSPEPPRPQQPDHTTEMTKQSVKTHLMDPLKYTYMTVYSRVCIPQPPAPV